MINVKEIIDIDNKVKSEISLCNECIGSGFVWSDLGFGDIPGDERKLKCKACNGTSRVKTIMITAIAEVPFDYCGEKKA